MFYNFYVALSVKIIATCTAVLISTPLSGTLVRFRVNYVPKDFRPATGSTQSHALPVVNSYFAIMKRIINLEGWRGLYKGFMPSLISTFLATTFYPTIFIVTSSYQRHSTPAVAPALFMMYTAFARLVGIPLTILINRAITTAHVLPWIRPTYALRRLFTPAERWRPWVLYATPGLLAATLLRLCYTLLMFTAFPAVLLPTENARRGYLPDDWSPTLHLAVYYMLMALRTAALCPLEVLTARLALQRTHAGPAALEADADAGAAKRGVVLRSEVEPYKGLADAVRRILDEEGWGVLYRGWWVTLVESAVSLRA